MEQILLKKEHPNCILPHKSISTSVGYDCYVSRRELKDGAIWYYLGFSAQLPQGHFAMLPSRSSIVKTDLVQANGVGIIDADYQGEWAFVTKLMPRVTEDFSGVILKTVFKLFYPEYFTVYNVGDKCCQFIVLQSPDTTIKEVTEFTNQTKRGTNGFGSTGK